MLLSFASFSSLAQKQKSLKADTIKTDTLVDASNMSVRYGSKGIELQTKDNKFLFQLQSRFQFRFATPGDADPVTYDDYLQGGHTGFKINRARLKVGGHAFEPWLKYYWEYELSQSNLLDFRIMIERYKWLNFKAGQWKAEFTRERFISSGEQQMMDRSLINRSFTLDRQQGVELYGELGKGIADFSYWAAAMTGTGRGNTKNDDNHLMYFGRLQWNFMGEPLEFEGGDLEHHEKPVAIVAASAVTNQSPYTRFSQAGGGSLEGFNADTAGRYRVNQWNLESALMYKGFSGQSEWHHKYIFDTLHGNALTEMEGYYAQAGYFFHGLIESFPRQLEIAARETVYRPNVDLRNNLQRETSLACNWFFKGHKNKLTAEVNYLSLQDPTVPMVGGYRFRIQWDISL
ncbi:porin [Mucilaginibacter sp. R11]|uniref:Porin n=2 Tax=Mucilaginibacter agri TaxID=2695265 RepID=A0A965ZJC3_9SPHI|nr:porin [Mucilaginibacter agri]